MAAAQMEGNTLHLSPMAGVIFPGHDVGLKNGAVFGLGLGYNFTKNWGIEGFASLAPNLDWKDLDPGETGDSTLFLGRLNGLYHFDTGTNFTPYVTVGVGAINANGDDDGSEYSSFSANGGVGFKYFFNEYVALRAEANEVFGFKKQDGNRVDATLVTAGLTFQFGAPQGCVDSDGDGVCDAYDKCPGTPAGYKVDADGCPITVSITLDVKFDFDKAVVKPQYRAEVQKAADFLSAHPGSSAVVEGHTDSRGADDYNLRLSQRRADAVRDYLVSQFGVNASRVQAVGYGESRPIATNDTDAGRAENRRVVGVFSGTDIDR
jgi:OOP family OmpA-OmpF porin